LTPTGLLSDGRFRRPRRAWRSRTSVGQLRFTHAGRRQFSTFHEFHNICYATFACGSFIEMRHLSNLCDSRRTFTAVTARQDEAGKEGLRPRPGGRPGTPEPSYLWSACRKTAESSRSHPEDSRPGSCASCLPARIVSRAVQH